MQIHSDLLLIPFSSYGSHEFVLCADLGGVFKTLLDFNHSFVLYSSLTLSHTIPFFHRHRMKGDKTLWLPGSDHAGIATQV